MADLNVNSIGDASGGTTATVNGFAPTVSNMAGRNRIINGDMRIDQRNAGASVTPTTNNTYTLDRWTTYVSQASKFSVQQNAGAVTPPAGFRNYLGATSLAATSLGASDYFFLQQVIEGFNVADLNWGTASAQTVTLSFWVRSSLTGTFGGSLRNESANRSYPFSYSISSANTWEQKTVTIAGDTTGTWVVNNGGGIQVAFSLGAGSTFSGTAGSWAGSNFVSATGATSVVGTNGATFYITGVQLEEGSVATPFEHRQYGQELALCKRYYQTFYSANYPAFHYSTSVYTGVILPVTMRTSPTITSNGQGTNYYEAGGAYSFSVSSYAGDNPSTVSLQGSVTGGTNGYAGTFAPTFQASAEL